MKLSELKGERAVEVMADLIEPIANIAANREKIKFNEVEHVEGESERDIAIRNLRVKLPVILRENKADLVSIIGIVTGENAEEMSFPRIMKEAIDLLSDKDFGELFLFARQMTVKKQLTEFSGIAEVSEPEH